MSLVLLMNVQIYPLPLMARSKLGLFNCGTSIDSWLRVEVAVKQILCGMNVKISASVANADCLNWYRQWNEDHA